MSRITVAPLRLVAYGASSFWSCFAMLAVTDSSRWPTSMEAAYSALSEQRSYRPSQPSESSISRRYGVKSLSRATTRLRFAPATATAGVGGGGLGDGMGTERSLLVAGDTARASAVRGCLHLAESVLAAPVRFVGCVAGTGAGFCCFRISCDSWETSSAISGCRLAALTRMSMRHAGVRYSGSMAASLFFISRAFLLVSPSFWVLFGGAAGARAALETGAAAPTGPLGGAGGAGTRAKRTRFAGCVDMGELCVDKGGPAWV